MQRELVPITLPWKRPRKGLVVAELGATFQVEWTNRGWQVSVRSGKRMTMLARELTRQRDGQCRAEAHAATMPEVLAAVANQTADAPSSEPAARRGGASSTGRRDPVKEARPEPTLIAPASPTSPPAPELIDYAKVNDGCICGRASSGTWAADPKGHIALPDDTPAEEAEQIRRFAADYFQRQDKSAPSSTPPVVDAAPAASPTPQGRKKAPKKGARRAREPQPTVDKSREASTAAAKKATARRAVRKDAAKTTPALAKPPSKQKSAASDRLAKARAAKAAKAQQATPTPAPAALKGAAREARPRRVGKPKQGDAKGDAPATPGGPAQLQWFQVEGRARANTPFGSFAIEAEGDREALYFYDLNGMSTFIADRGDLRQIAAERAARGGVRPNVAQRSPELDAQMRNLFFEEDVR